MQFCLSGHFRQIPHFFQSYICFISIWSCNISCKLFRFPDTGQIISIKSDIRSGFQALNQMIHIIVQSHIGCSQAPRFIIVTIIYQMTNRISFKSRTYSIPGQTCFFIKCCIYGKCIRSNCCRIFYSRIKFKDIQFRVITIILPISFIISIVGRAANCQSSEKSEFNINKIIHIHIQIGPGIQPVIICITSNLEIITFTRISQIGIILNKVITTRRRYISPLIRFQIIKHHILIVNSRIYFIIRIISIITGKCRVIIQRRQTIVDTCLIIQAGIFSGCRPFRETIYRADPAFYIHIQYPVISLSFFSLDKNNSICRPRSVHCFTNHIFNKCNRFYF